LAHARAYSTLTGITEISVVPETGEIYLLSPDERQVGVTRLDKQGRIPFPSILPLEGKPLAMAVGALKQGAEATLAVIVDQDGKRTLWTRAPGGETATQKFNENFKANPTLMAFHDADQDGSQDLIVLIPYEKMKILRQVQGKDFEELDIAPPGGSLEQPWMSATDIDGDGRKELLLAQKNFVRAVVLKSEAAKGESKTWSFTVKDQINGASSSSRIVGAAPLQNGTNGIMSLFLLDAERKALTVCERGTNASWQVVRNVALPFTEFTELQSVAFGGKKPNTIAFFGANAIGWMSLKGDVWQFTELDGYETPIKDGHLHDVVSGDLNGDKRRDLVFLETGKNYLDIVIFDSSGKLVPANRWQVFEERSFRGRRGDQPEPREALITDLTGDGKNDLAVIVHDRILVYPQE
ncbi:MAG TPA: VCBS repeat-containing protein, partial [Verrucomicrobiae bacterium]|nr:VCBS repeat-containing protein [Verrucomicrobiae bacterium]